MELIEKLKKIDLARVTDEELQEIFSSFPELFIDSIILPKGIIIYRCRENEILPTGHPKLFTNVDDISYRKDTDNINKYGRCNIRNQSLFYGTLALEKTDELQRKRQAEVCTLALFETLNQPIPPVIDNNLLITYSTVGQWMLTEPIQVLIIHQHEDFHKNLPFLKEFYDQYIEKVKSKHPNKAEDFILVNQFFANEYAKFVDGTDYEYKLSANFTNVIVAGARTIGKEIDGIIYPSAKSLGGGYNIAINPKIIDNGKLKLIAAMADKVYMYNTNVNPVPIYASKEFPHNQFKWVNATEVEKRLPTIQEILISIGVIK